MKRALALLLVLSSATALAQDAPKLDENPDQDTQRYANSKWSMQQPDGSFEPGCETGYMTFQLRAGGFFVFNNRTSGSWSVDRADKTQAVDRLRLRTRRGARLILLPDDTGQLIRVLGVVPGVRILRGTVFQRCSSDL